MLLDQAPEREVYPIPPHVFTHREQREWTLTVGRVRIHRPKERHRLAYGPDRRRLPEKPAEPLQVLAPVRFLHNAHRCVPREAFRDQPHSLGIRVWYSPLVRHLVRDDRERKIEPARIVVRIEE